MTDDPFYAPVNRVRLPPPPPTTLGFGTKGQARVMAERFAVRANAGPVRRSPNRPWPHDECPGPGTMHARGVSVMANRVGQLPANRRVIGPPVDTPSPDAMPWTCPACDHPIRPRHGFPPFPHVIYRCKLCGLALTLSNETHTLVVASADPSAKVPPKIPV